MTPFAALGAWLSSLVPEPVLRGCIAVAMVIFLVLSFFKPKEEEPTSDELDLPDSRPSMLVGFGLMGLYAGFLQAGVGVLILLFLGLGYRASLVAANGLKIVVVTVLTAGALLAFVVVGADVDVWRGLCLGAGSMVGGFWGARHAIARGERLIRSAVVLAVGASAVKLLWDILP
jgi:uncharacterized membrane protein YfcA